MRGIAQSLFDPCHKSRCEFLAIAVDDEKTSSSERIAVPTTKHAAM